MELYLKLDQIAMLRSSGGGREPEPVVAASLAELEGVGGITIHLHADRSAVHVRDVQVLKETLSVPLNLELSPLMKNRQQAFDLRPYSVTLVQEPKDVKADRWPVDEMDKDQIGGFVDAFDSAEIEPAVFIKPSISAVRWVKKINPKILVIDTMPYALAKTWQEQKDQFSRLEDCTKLGRKLGMQVHGGGGIDYRNIYQLATLPFSAIHVGHSIVARSVMVGMTKAVRSMLDIMEKVHR